MQTVMHHRHNLTALAKEHAQRFVKVNVAMWLFKPGDIRVDTSTHFDILINNLKARESL